MKLIEVKKSFVFKCPYNQPNAPHKYCLNCINYKGISLENRKIYKILCDKDEDCYNNILYSKILLIETKMKEFIIR